MSGASRKGIPVTSVHRTIFDLAATAPVDEVIAMIKEAEYLNLWDRLSLWDLLERYPGKRGSRDLRFSLTHHRRAFRPQAKQAGGALHFLPAPPSPAAAPLQRLDL
jgi:hypothetical protein